ncbi:hypothetical protein ECZU41_54020 [Escherichia coli]|nr:hypothetical protein ECZU41_54020 [Escherichia coli]
MRFSVQRICSWEYVPDHRGETHSIDTGIPKKSRCWVTIRKYNHYRPANTIRQMGWREMGG